MARRCAWAVLLLLCVFAGCKDEIKGGVSGSEPGDPSLYKPTPWPPPGAQPAPAPPGVIRVMELAVNAFAAKDEKALRGLFMDRQGFLGMSDCDAATVKQVLEGIGTAMEQMNEYGGNVQWRGFSETYAAQVPRGEKPHRDATCTAKMDVELFQARYQWEVNDTLVVGEAHLMRAQHQGAWRFVRLGALH
jgi:hypothetical protein